MIIARQIGREVVALRGEVKDGKVTLGAIAVIPIGVWTKQFKLQENEEIH